MTAFINEIDEDIESNGSGLFEEFSNTKRDKLLND
jgi:uncharacterized membrane protein